MSKRIIYTAGVFDLFHVGHLELLTESKKLGDWLVVGVITDEGCADYKNRYPIVPYVDRVAIVAGLRCVDEVILQWGTNPSGVLSQMNIEGRRPFAMTHGDDWDRLIQGNETLEELGIHFITIPRTTGESTTHLRETVKGVQ